MNARRPGGLPRVCVACGAAGVPGGGPARCVCWWAAARPRAVRAASFARRVGSLSGQAPPPPTGTAAGPSGILHTCRAWLLACGSARCLNVWPDPSKPASPLLVRAEPQLKPSSPLRARNGCFSCAFRSQRCCGFQRLLLRGEHWCWRFHAGLHQWLQRCHWFQSWHVAVSCARKSSPCMPKTAEKRCFQARWANFVAEMPLEGPRWANFFAGKLLEAPRRANFVAHAGAPAHVRSLRCPPCLQWWGFCTTRVASRIVV